MSEDIRCGTVRKWNAERGFGFVRCDSGQDVFIHVSATDGLPLAEGQRVACEVGPSGAGRLPRAIRCQLLEPDAPCLRAVAESGASNILKE